MKPSLGMLAALLSGQINPGEIDNRDWDEIISIAVCNGVAPMLLYMLRQNSQVTMPGSSWEPLIQATQRAAVNYALQKKAYQCISSAYSKQGIQAIWLKGIVLAHTVYPEPWLRPMVDLDVLVPKDQRLQALKIAEELGFSPLAEDYLSFLDPPDSVHYHDQLKGREGMRVCLEIHFRLLGLEGDRLLPEEQLKRFRDQAQAWGTDQLHGMGLNSESHLLFLCAHALIQHGEAYLDLLHLLDIHLLVTKSNLDWQTVVESTSALQWVSAVQRALNLAKMFFATRMPESVLEQLHERVRGDPNHRFVTKLKNDIGRWEEWKIIYQRQPILKRIRMVMITLFPPKKFMRFHYAIQPARPVFPYYLYRWMDGGREVARSIGQNLSRHF